MKAFSFFLRRSALGVTVIIAALTFPSFGTCQGDAKKKSASSSKGEPKPILIKSTGGAEVFPDKNMFVYIENVRFVHPEQKMLVTCDRLEIYRDPPPKPPPRPPLEEEAAKGKVPEKAPKQPEIRQAIAIGHVYLEKIGDDGENRTGTGEKAIFDSKSHEVRLYGSPTLHIDRMEFKALRKDCVVILKEDGKHRLQGPFNTIAHAAKGDK